MVKVPAVISSRKRSVTEFVSVLLYVGFCMVFGQISLKLLKEALWSSLEEQKLHFCSVLVTRNCP